MCGNLVPISKYYTNQITNYILIINCPYWIGRGGALAWATKLPDLNLIDIFYEVNATLSEEDLLARIIMNT